MSLDMGESNKRTKSGFHLDEKLFTFKPKLNPKSTLLASQVQTSFLERQNSHSQKQLEVLKKALILSSNHYEKLIYPYKLAANTDLKSNSFLKSKVSLIFFFKICSQIYSNRKK